MFTISDLKTLPDHIIESWKAKGVEAAQTTYNDVSSLEQAFEGAEAVNLTSTWAFGRRYEQAET